MGEQQPSSTPAQTGCGCLVLIAAVFLIGSLFQGGGDSAPDESGTAWSADQCGFTLGLIEGGALSGQELENAKDNYDAFC